MILYWCYVGILHFYGFHPANYWNITTRPGLGTCLHPASEPPVWSHREDENGRFDRIVEEKDAAPEIKVSMRLIRDVLFQAGLYSTP